MCFYLFKDFSYKMRFRERDNPVIRISIYCRISFIFKESRKKRKNIFLKKKRTKKKVVLKSLSVFFSSLTAFSSHFLCFSLSPNNLHTFGILTRRYMIFEEQQNTKKRKKISEPLYIFPFSCFLFSAYAYIIGALTV